MLKLTKFVRKYDTILYILALIVVGLLLVGITKGFCASKIGNVKDNNNGNQGYILINAGQRQGNDDIGTWVDPTTIPTLKGDKGDKGDTGSQGIQGIQGIKGDTGKDGLNGLNGAKGDKGEQGIQGNQGDKGDNGKDVDPTIVTNLQNEDITLQNNINTEQFDRINMGNNLQNNVNVVDINSKNRDNTLQNNINNEVVNRINGDNLLNERINDVSNRVSKLERTQFKLQVGVRIFDSKHITITPYISQNFTRSCIDEVGIRVTLKIGKSYEEKLIENTNKRVTELEKRIGLAPIIEKVIDTRGNIKSIRITENGLSVDGKF